MQPFFGCCCLAPKKGGKALQKRIHVSQAEATLIFHSIEGLDLRYGIAQQSLNFLRKNITAILFGGLPNGMRSGVT